jgi:hypothetical protein
MMDSKGRPTLDEAVDPPSKSNGNEPGRDGRKGQESAEAVELPPQDSHDDSTSVARNGDTVESKEAGTDDSVALEKLRKSILLQELRGMSMDEVSRMIAEKLGRSADESTSIDTKRTPQERMREFLRDKQTSAAGPASIDTKGTPQERMRELLQRRNR